LEFRGYFVNVCVVFGGGACPEVDEGRGCCCCQSGYCCFVESRHYKMQGVGRILLNEEGLGLGGEEVRKFQGSKVRHHFQNENLQKRAKRKG